MQNQSINNGMRPSRAIDNRGPVISEVDQGACRRTEINMENVSRRCNDSEEEFREETTSKVAQIYKYRRRRRRSEILKSKKKDKRKRKKVISECSCSQRRKVQNQVYPNPKLNLVGCKSKRNSWAMLHGNVVEVAKGVWDLGKEIGLVHRGEEGEIVQELAVRVKGGEGSV